VEFTSFFTFVVGAVEGAVAGVFFGSFIMFVNGFFSPYGFAGLNLPFQMVGMALVGVVGSLYRRCLSGKAESVKFCVETAVLGAFVTLAFDVITNVGVGFSFILVGMNPVYALFSALAYGVFFSIIHICSNATVFGVLFLPLMKALKALKAGEIIG